MKWRSPSRDCQPSPLGEDDIVHPHDPALSSGQARLRIGLIGVGAMGRQHLLAIRGCSFASVVAVADPQADADEVRALTSPQTAVVSSAEELLTTLRPDVVHIVTPPATHGFLARAALEAGAHVYVEKPFTLRRDEAAAILSLAGERGLSACAGHQCLFEHAALRGLSLVSTLGRIVHVESYFSFRPVRRIPPIDQAKDILPHAVYMAAACMRASRPESNEPIVLRGIDSGSDGSVHAVLKLDDCRGVLIVTLTGRPVEHYVRIVGTNGSLRIDLVSDAVLWLPGPGVTAPTVLTNPYRQAAQLVTGTTSGIVRRFRERRYGYPGLRQLCESFYGHVLGGGRPPLAPASILETVALCEQIGGALDASESQAEAMARTSLIQRERERPPASEEQGAALVTGAAGFLGRAVVRELRQRGHQVRALTRQPVLYGSREAGVAYSVCDLAAGIPEGLLSGVTTIVHCAAETRGGQKEHQRNSVRATRELIEAAALARVSHFVFVGSTAVMKSGSRLLDESTPVDVGNLARGPYVWGKAESETLATTLGRERGLEVKVVRLGPLVDFAAFDPPGRLGREVGPVFVAVGPRRRELPLCDVSTAAMVLRSYVDRFEEAPPLVNLVEPKAPTRRELVAMLRSRRPDLRVVWLPLIIVRVMGAMAWIVQRLAGKTHPLDLVAAFSTPRFRTETAARVVAAARTPGRRRTSAESPAGAR